MENKEKMKAINVVWETDGEKIDLPTEVDLPNNIDEESIADYLSDKYGWLVLSFETERFNLFKIVIPAENREPEHEIGWYYINTTPEKLQDFIFNYLYGDEENEQDFWCFLEELKKHYIVEEYILPEHFIINY